MPQVPGRLLTETLQEQIPLALAMGTEKARSELIVAPVLVEVWRLAHRRISLFSGIEFNVNPAAGLQGFCDFLISKSEEQYVLRSPVVAVVEAKKGEIEIGLGQCAAEMVAAQQFNAQHHAEIRQVAGVVTTGSSWKFLTLTNHTLCIQADEIALEHLDKILGLFAKLIEAA